ncbi:aminotransferase class I/II-fold pyridoxal phosphate-dependent enzyme [Leptolyngbya sp. GB1-A1]|uniref:aminotransferase class I/II-fold pyridoxal phosphate-dependent enzyme n=1 Tax=Leptolyngbya sp. GB1-A1 TaxID=2933908 RepID=UPI003299E142
MSNRFCLYPRINLDIGFADLLFSLSSLVYPFKQEEPKILQQFAQNDKQVLVTLSVRTAFDLLLQALDLPEGSEVLMSAVTIPDMVEIVKSHGLVPVAINISIDTLAPDIDALEQKITDKTKLILIAHLYGTVLDLTAVIQIARKYNILLIEDCAQAFWGDKYCGDRQADVSLFSFGPIKSCTALGSAIACVGDRELANKMLAIQAQYPCKSKFWFFRRVLKYLFLKLLTLPRIYFLLMVVVNALGFKLDAMISILLRNFSKGDLHSKIRYLPPQKMVDLLWHRLNNYDNEAFEQRAKRARFVLALFSDKINYPGVQATNHSFWLVPIFVANPVLLINILRNHGFDATTGNTSLVHIGNDSTQNIQKNTLLEKHLKQQILYLPISEYLSEIALTDMADLVRENASPTTPFLDRI